MNGACYGFACAGIERAVAFHIKHAAAFNAPDASQPAVVGDVGGFRGPRRDCADARDHQKNFALASGCTRPAVGEERIEYADLGLT